VWAFQAQTTTKAVTMIMFLIEDGFNINKTKTYRYETTIQMVYNQSVSSNK